MKRLGQVMSFLRPFRGALILAGALTGVLTVIGMAPPLLMKGLINDVARQGHWGLFPLLIVGLFAVPVLRGLVNIVTSVALNKAGVGIIRETRSRVFRHLMRLTMRFYNEMPAGAIQQRLVPDVANISSIATGGMVTLLSDVVSILFAVLVMLMLSWQLSLMTFALLPLYYLNYWFFSKKIEAANVLLRSRMDHISSTLQERLSAHELIQSYGQEKQEASHFSSQARQIMDAAVRGSAYNISFNQLADFLNKIGNTGIYCAGCYFLVLGWMGYGDVVAFCAYATLLVGPVIRFATVANQFVQVGVSVDRVQELLNRKPAIEEAPDAAPVEALRGDVKVDGVTYGFGEGKPVLEGVHLEIPAGTHLAVVGPAGSGRTTLAMLLRRFYDPASGTIEVDGRDIKGLRLRDYRKALALVMPEAAIFDGTIRENLCYGRPDAPEQRMIEVCEALGLHEFVTGLSDGYDTRVGTGGLQLSAGIRQQIGIARALISEPFILIFDEATASLDPETAERVIDAVRAAMGGRTCVLIVYRVLMAQRADRVVVIDKGKVVQTGSHRRLLRQPDSLYRVLFARQYGGDRLPEAEEGGAP